MKFKLDLHAMSLLISGGAAGADTVFATLAQRAGHRVLIYTTRNCPSLEMAKPYVIRANQTLNRRYPNEKPHLNALLERNYFQIADTSAVYAVGLLSKNGKIQGGTTWACQMFYDLIGTTRPLYFFDMNTNVWYLLIGNPNLDGLNFGNRWTATQPPRPGDVYSRYTGIGSRKLKDNGQQAIFDLYI